MADTRFGPNSPKARLQVKLEGCFPEKMPEPERSEVPKRASGWVVFPTKTSKKKLAYIPIGSQKSKAEISMR
jgi:hypothetical protein